jgi:hypothetical protein
MANESPDADENAGHRLRKVLGLRDLIPMQILIVIGPSWTGTAAHQAGTHVSFWILGTFLLFLPLSHSDTFLSSYRARGSVIRLSCLFRCRCG